jgi:hypothetical protein
MITGESLFCFFEEARDPKYKGQWALSVAVWKGGGQKEVAYFPPPAPGEDHNIYENVLWYLNNPDHENVVLPFDRRVEIECGRQLGDYVWIFWHTFGGTHDRYAKKVDGIWVDATEELKDIFVPLWDYLKEETEKKEGVQQETTDDSVIEQEADDAQSEEIEVYEEELTDSSNGESGEMAMEHETADSQSEESEEKSEDDRQLSLF